MRTFAAMLMVLATAAAAAADPSGAEKARDMLARAVAAVERDPKAAMEKFSAGADGFRDGDLYPFCFRTSDGIVLVGQTAGSDIRSFPGVGPMLFEAGKVPEGQTSEIRYRARRPPPADATPVDKISVVRRIGEVACGVGYYP